jgi:hypothetical protein
MIEPTLVQCAPQQIAAVKRRTAIGDVPKVLIPALDVVWAFIRGNKLRFGLNVAIYRHLGDDVVDMTCGVEVAQPFEEAGEVVRDYTPAGEAARGLHVGPYDRLGETYDRVAAFIVRSRRQRAGVNWEVYGHWTDDPAKLETDVYMLLKAA